MKTIAMMAVAAFSAASFTTTRERQSRQSGTDQASGTFGTFTVCNTKPKQIAVLQAVRNARQRLPASVATAHFKVESNIV